jgi:putative resolvase
MENYLINTSEPLTLLTAREAARYLRVSISTLNRIERRGMLNPLRIPGGHRRYTVDILNECLQRGDIEADVQDLENA